MHFHKEWIIVPLICIGFFLFINSINPACSWGEITELLNVGHNGNYTQVAILAVALITLCTVLRILRSR